MPVLQRGSLLAMLEGLEAEEVMEFTRASRAADGDVDVGFTEVSAEPEGAHNVVPLAPAGLDEVDADLPLEEPPEPVPAWGDPPEDEGVLVSRQRRAALLRANASVRAP